MRSRSVALTDSTGTRAILDTTFSMSLAVIRRVRSASGFILSNEPASSTTSIALSGRNLSTMCLAARRAAASMAASS